MEIYTTVVAALTILILAIVSFLGSFTYGAFCRLSDFFAPQPGKLRGGELLLLPLAVGGIATICSSIYRLDVALCAIGIVATGIGIGLYMGIHARRLGKGGATMDGLFVLVAIVCIASAALFGSLGFATGRSNKRGLRFEKWMAVAVCTIVLVANIVVMHDPAFYAVCGTWLGGYALGSIVKLVKR